MDICLDNPAVSGFHALLEFNNNQWTVSDNESTNGVFIDGRKINGKVNAGIGSVVRIIGVRIVLCNGFIAINSGGLFGNGPGNSKQISYIPESHTDSVFAIIAEEMGVLKCSVIFILYIIILYRILKISMNSKMISSKFICLFFISII